jgi:hypothetical protein
MSRPDTILGHHLTLPYQSYGAWNSSEDLPSIKRFMLAVIENALECIAGRAVCTKGPEARRIAQEAADWVADVNESDAFSFNSVCDSLGLDPDAVRLALTRWLASGPRMSRRPPVTRQVRLSVAAYRRRSPRLRRAADD